jgi:hypothetical protein
MRLKWNRREPTMGASRTSLPRVDDLPAEDRVAHFRKRRRVLCLVASDHRSE